MEFTTCSEQEVLVIFSEQYSWRYTQLRYKPLGNPKRNSFILQNFSTFPSVI